MNQDYFLGFLGFLVSFFGLLSLPICRFSLTNELYPQSGWMGAPGIRAASYNATIMSEFSRRSLLTSAAVAPLLAQQAGRVATAPEPGVIPNRKLLSGRITAGALQSSL